MTAREEAYRILRSNLIVGLMDLDRPSVLVTSANAGEGKTFTTVNLARALALAGHRVVLVDLDMRHPDAHQWLAAPNHVGASDVLTRRRVLRDSIQYVPLGGDHDSQGGGLYFLAAGPVAANPAELLSSPRTPALLEALASQADVVLIDTPPVLPVADTLVIGRMVGGAVLVVETRKTALNAVQQAKDSLTRSQARLLGVVVNKLQPRDARSDHGYGYPYEYPHVSGRRVAHPRAVRNVGTDDAFDTTPTATVSPAPTTYEHSTNGFSAAESVDLPWPSATEPTMVAGALPPAPSFRVGIGGDTIRSEESRPAEPASGYVSVDTAAQVDGNGHVDRRRPKRLFRRRR